MKINIKKRLIVLTVLVLLCVLTLPVQAVQKPVADLSVSKTSGVAPLTVTFTDISKGGKALWKWWGFGDGIGSDSTANTVTHIYTKPGTYTVFLKVTNAAGTSTKTYPVPLKVTDQKPNIVTHWGFAHENDYNEIIIQEIAEVWDDSKHPIDPLYVKAIIATESSFNKDDSNGNYCGLMQTPVNYAYSKIHGGQWNDPRTSIHVGLSILKGKMRAMSASSITYNKNTIGNVGVITPPSDNTELWNFVFASYNGGEGTIGNAMAYAKQTGRDPQIWKNIVEPQSQPEKSPLYKAVLLNKWGITKYNEINNYITGQRGVRHWLSS